MRGKLPGFTQACGNRRFTAPGDSEIEELPRDPTRRRKAADGALRAGKGLFSETQGARDGLSFGGASRGTGGISCTTDRRWPPAQACRARSRTAKTWRCCQSPQGSSSLRPRCVLSALPWASVVLPPRKHRRLVALHSWGFPESYWASRADAATGVIAGVEGKRIRTPGAVA